MNSCDLVFASIKEDKPLKNFKAMMNWHLYEQSEFPHPERDSNNSLFIVAGTDNFMKIGEP